MPPRVQPAQRLRHQGNTATALQSINCITPEQIYKLGAEALGWNNSTAAGKALIDEDMKLLKRLQLMAFPPSADHRHQLRSHNRFLPRPLMGHLLPSS